MKIKYYDAINAKEKIKIDVNAKVAHFLKEEANKKRKLSKKQIKNLPQKKREQYYQRKFENNLISLDELIEDGFQPTSLFTIHGSLSTIHKENEYLRSREYVRFINSLKVEIKKTFNIMSETLRTIMFLRYFKNMSIGQIARQLDYEKPTIQTYLSRGTEYLRYFLDEDISMQDKIERMKKMKREQAKYNS